MTDVQIQYPWALSLLVLLPIVFYLKPKFAAPKGFSFAALIRKIDPPGLFKQYSLNVLVSMVMLFSILAVANIRYSSYWQTTFMESKWIMIIQDLSGSMNRLGDEREPRTLGDISLDGVRAFIDLRHKDDLIGLIAFSSYAKLISPPTFDKKVLKERLTLLARDSDSVIFRELTLGGATNASYAAWLALCTLFMLLPEDNQPSFEELNDFRHALLGRTLKKIPIPANLAKVDFGHGMAIVLFTDGRIEANQSANDVRKGLPNFVNVVKLLNKLNIKLYLIVVGAEVNDDVRAAIEDATTDRGGGRIFYMPRRFSLKKIEEVYGRIDEMEKNRLLVKIEEKQKETRRLFSFMAMLSLVLYCFLRISPWLKKI
jgi:hypothetical protein